MTPPLPSTPPGLYDRAEEAAAAIRAAAAEPPRIAVVLGSGLGEVADRLADAVVLAHDRIPHFPRPTAEGHRGRVVVGRLGGTPALVLQGRVHYYEGYDLETTTFPVRVFQRLGVETLILTAATGGISPHLSPGDFVLLNDHLNMLGTTPLRGPNDDRLGTRFPDLTEVYSARLRRIAREEADALSIRVTEGVYACWSGPCYETPAEIRMLRVLGADVVGMSTVPEAIVARHAGIDVLAIALVSNAAAGVVGTPITHEEVLAAGREAGPKLATLIEAVIARLAGGGETARPDRNSVAAGS